MKNTTTWILAGLVATLSLTALPAAGQSTASGSKTATAAKAAFPKTPWGDPDLQGTWSTDSAYAIPLQRPPQFAGRADLTDEEFKAKVETDTKRRERALKIDRKSTRLNSSHSDRSRMPSSA